MLAAPLTTVSDDGVPRRQAWATRLGARYARRRFAHDFDGLFVAGLDAARALGAQGPVLFAATHVSWWDPLALLVLDAALQTDGRALMDAENLRRLPFFGAVGALPLHRGGDRGRLRRDLAAAVATLDQPGRALWIFPQGRQRPATTRPLGIEPGVRLLARQAGAPVVPVALRYGWREAERPAVVVHFGAPLDGKRRDLLPALEDALIAGLDRGEELLDHNGLVGGQVPDGSPFHALVPPAQVASDDDLATRTLSGLTRVLTRLAARRQP